MPFKDPLYSQSHLATEGGILLYNLTFLFMTMNEKMSFICHMAIDIQIYVSLFIQINIAKMLHLAYITNYLHITLVFFCWILDPLPANSSTIYVHSYFTK